MKPNTLEAVLNTLQEVDGELKGSIYFAKFDKTVSLHFYPDLREQSERYIETFLNWGEDLFKKLQNSSYKYCQDFQDAIGEVNVEINSSAEIWNHCDPVRIYFESYIQDPSSTFIDIELNCDWEEEHGMQWLIKNADKPIFVGAYDGISIDFALELDESRGILHSRFSSLDASCF